MSKIIVGFLISLFTVLCQKESNSNVTKSLNQVTDVMSEEALTNNPNSFCSIESVSTVCSGFYSLNVTFGQIENAVDSIKISISCPANRATIHRYLAPTEKLVVFSGKELSALVSGTHNHIGHVLVSIKYYSRKAISKKVNIFTTRTRADFFSEESEF